MKTDWGRQRPPFHLEAIPGHPLGPGEAGSTSTAGAEKGPSDAIALVNTDKPPPEPRRPPFLPHDKLESAAAVVVTNGVYLFVRSFFLPWLN